MSLAEFEPSMYIKTAAASECHIEVWEGVAQPWERLYDISSAITSEPKFILRNYLHTTTAAAAAAVVAAYDCESGCELEQQWQLLWAHYNIINPQIWLIDSLTLQPHLNSTQHNRIGKCTFHLSPPKGFQLNTLGLRLWNIAKDSARISGQRVYDVQGKIMMFGAVRNYSPSASLSNAGILTWSTQNSSARQSSKLPSSQMQ